MTWEGEGVGFVLADGVMSTVFTSVVVAVTVKASIATVSETDEVGVGHSVGNDVNDAAVELSCT